MRTRCAARLSLSAMATQHDTLARLLLPLLPHLIVKEGMSSRYWLLNLCIGWRVVVGDAMELTRCPISMRWMCEFFSRNFIPFER